MTQPDQTQRTRLDYIDALRGVAALWVVLYHLWRRFYPDLSDPAWGMANDWRGLLSQLTLGYGYMGVTLFFVLSGFCIHLPHAKHPERPLALQEFARRRFWRLYPAYAASIMLTIGALATPKLALATTGRSFNWWSELRITDAIVSSVFLQPLWPSSLGFNGVYWTLAYEVQFYLAYPLLLWSTRRTGLLWVGLFLFLGELWLTPTDTSMRPFFLARYFEWFLGVVSAELLVSLSSRNQRTPVEGLLRLVTLIGLSLGVYSTFHPRLIPFRDLFLAIGFASLIVSLANVGGAVRAVTTWRPLVTLGMLSYSLYLVHVPVIDVIWTGLQRLIVPEFGEPILVMRGALIAIPASLFLAWVSYRFLERPFLVGRRIRS